MSRHTRATTVVSQPPRFSTSLGVGAAEPQPRLLHGVVGLAQRAEHAVGHRPQVGPVLLEPLGQPFVLVHLSPSQPRALRRRSAKPPSPRTGHSPPWRPLTAMTDETSPM